MKNAKLDIHVLLDAYFELNQESKYDPELDLTINQIAHEWDYEILDGNIPSTEKITDFVLFNPKRIIKKGETKPFVKMAALPIDNRNISNTGSRTYKGGGSRFQDGDTLFARITPCLENGKTAKTSGLGNGVIAHGSTEFIVMTAKEPEYDEDYIYYLARSPEFRTYAQSRMEGTSGRQRVSWQSLAEFEFDFPDKEDRKEIGRILKSIDDKIQVNNQ